MSTRPASCTATGSARRIVIAALGVTQILAWGSSYYLLAVLGTPIAADTGWPLSIVVGGLSLGLLAGGLASPAIGRTIDAKGGRPSHDQAGDHRISEDSCSSTSILRKFAAIRVLYFLANRWHPTN